MFFSGFFSALCISVYISLKHRRYLSVFFCHYFVGHLNRGTHARLKRMQVCDKSWCEASDNNNHNKIIDCDNNMNIMIVVGCTSKIFQLLRYSFSSVSYLINALQEKY